MVLPSCNSMIGSIPIVMVCRSTCETYHIIARVVCEPSSLLWYLTNVFLQGDIGTSPLYVMSSTFYANDGAPRPSTDDVVGVTSLIIWTITWIVVRLLQKRRCAISCVLSSTSCAGCEDGFIV